MRVLYMDIETNMKPHSKDEQEVICVHNTLCHDGAHKVPIEHRTFLYVHSSRWGTLTVDEEKIAEIVHRQILGKFPINLVPGKNFDVVLCPTEKDLLARLMEYTAECQISHTAHYNGDSFNWSFNQLRLEKHGYRGARPYQFEAGRKRREYKCLSLSKRCDRAVINYKRENKETDSKKKTKAVKQYLLEKSEALYANEVEEYEPEEEDYYLDDRVVENNHMLEAWSIHNLCFNNAGSRDVMKQIPNQVIYEDETNPTDKRLDSTSYTILKIRKIDHPDVKYENLERTWRTGDNDILIAYCIIDVLLTWGIDAVLMSGIMDVTTANSVFLPVREIKGNQTLVRTLSMMNNYMWYRGIVSPDPSNPRNEERHQVTVTQ
ncbi:hypothetical protein EGW08_014213 [Elysia chlorotica]|uniref:Exonuclease domain-containing protein n=1 Tax=Elysia chlorotica TaxID=188477 RepID=A0A3S0ZLZ2_ELYCH|nr:hypothetical protein EGW08_014213 [Elysia chlorotica]